MRSILWVVLLCFLLSLTSTVTAATFDEVMSLYQKGKYEEARQAFTGFIQNSPGDAHALDAKYYVAICYSRLGDYEGFKAQAEAFLAENPQAPIQQKDDLKFNLAMIPFQQEKWADAKKSLEVFALESSTSVTSTWAQVWAIKSQYMLGDYEGFKAKAEVFLANNPKSDPQQKEELNFRLAMVPFQEGNWTEAKQALEVYSSEGVTTVSRNWARVWACKCQFMLGDYDGF